MFAPTLITDSLSPFRRFIAALGVALVLLLGVAAVNPVVHEHLHDGDHTPHGSTPAPHACAVVLFASGITFAMAALAVAAPHLAWREHPVPATAELFLAPPRYLRQPERGPPALQ